jgi:hypothetical protein
MDDVELSQQTSRRSVQTEDDQRTLERSNSIKREPDSAHAMIPEAPKNRLGSIVPLLPLLRPLLKGCIAVLISLIFVFDDRLRNEFGQGVILVPIGTVLGFPFRPIGTHFI